jgi:hypothetical protein
MNTKKDIEHNKENYRQMFNVKEVIADVTDVNESLDITEDRILFELYSIKATQIKEIRERISDEFTVLIGSRVNELQTGATMSKPTIEVYR